jgi:multiple sugar transport system permease protein
MPHLTRRQLSEITAGYGFAAPALLILLGFGVLPIALSAYFGFTRYNIMAEPTWVGLSNYLRLLNDGAFKVSFLNTLRYAAIVVPIQTVIALLLALALNSLVRLKSFFAASYFVPVITSSVVATLIWKILYNPTFGLLNALLSRFGIPHQIWLGDADLALPSIAAVIIWRNVGFFMVIIWAGLQGIPQQIEEAARVDGAQGIALLRFVTIPLLAPTLLLVLIIGVIQSLQIFPEVWIMTLGGPGRASSSVVLDIYQTAFREWQIGYGSAKAIVLFIAILLASSANLKLMGRGLESFY